MLGKLLSSFSSLLVGNVSASQHRTSRRTARLGVSVPSSSGTSLLRAVDVSRIDSGNVSVPSSSGTSLLPMSRHELRMKESKVSVPSSPGTSLLPGGSLRRRPDCREFQFPPRRERLCFRRDGPVYRGGGPALV